MQHTESLAIEYEQSEVWKLVGDPHTWPDWAPDFADLEFDGEPQ